MLNATNVKTIINAFKKSYKVDTVKLPHDEYGEIKTLIADNEKQIIFVHADSDQYLLDVLRGNFEESNGDNLEYWRGLNDTRHENGGACHGVTVSQKVLRYLDKAVARSDIRYYLNGLAVYPNGGLAATDGHRLHFNDAARDHCANTGSAEAKIISSDTLTLALKLDRKNDFQFSLYSGELVIVTTASHDFKLTAKQVDGKYPQIGRVIPKHKSHVAYVAPVQKELNLMATVAKQYGGKYSGIRVESNGAIEAVQEGSFAPLPAVAFKLFEVGTPTGLNAAYVRDALRAGEAATVRTGTPNESVLIEYPTDGLNAVLMPMRL